MSSIQNTEFESVGYREKQFGLQLVNMKDLFTDKPAKKRNPFQPHRINFFTLLVLTEGEMIHEVDFVKHKMVKGDCFLVCKNQIHRFDQSSSYNGYGIIFTEDFLLHYFSKSAITKIGFLYNYPLNPSVFKDFGDSRILISALKRELSLDLGEVKVDIAASILAVFLLKIQFYVDHGPKSYRDGYKQFMELQILVSEQFNVSRSTKDYASLLNTTYKQLNKLCRTFTNRTTKEYIIEYTILEAKRRLATTTLPIKYIAYECGFSEETNFAKFFKKSTGITPANFRDMRM